jgi:hypothetical protein
MTVLAHICDDEGLKPFQLHFILSYSRMKTHSHIIKGMPTLLPGVIGFDEQVVVTTIHLNPFR